MNTDFDTIADPAIRPQDDFFSYVNKKWIAEHPIPDSEVRWGTFNILRDSSWKAMRAIYESLQKTQATDTVSKLARDFYHAGMHYDDFASTHYALLETFYVQIEAISNTKELSAYIGRLNAMQLGAPWYVWVDVDHDDSTRHILHINQSGLTLPNREYYLDTSETMQKIRSEYQHFAKQVYREFPALAKTEDELSKVLEAFETSIATHSRTSAALRDIEANFNKTSYSTLQKTYDNIDWDAYKGALGWNADQDLSVDQPEFLLYINSMMKEQSLENWKTYLKWRLTIRCMAKMSDKLSKLQFSFFGKVLSGTTEMQPLWKRVVLAADGAIGEATGKLYAEKHFPKSSKQQVLSLVEDVRTAYAQRIDTLEWMSEPTKQYAKQKLANIKVLIGYPDTWRDFSALALTRDSYLGNVLEARKFDMAYWLDKLSQPATRDDWFMNPQTVNAYNDPNRLVICFPAAILQAPFFDPKAPLEVNMGGIGMVIGHEFTHGFDDQGCQFDAKGNVKTWQTEEERAAFAKRAQVIVDQADAFRVLPDLTLKGALVIGESIADLGGIEIAFQALANQLGSSPDEQAKKRFFMNYTFTQCGSIRKEKLREYTLVDPHPSSEYRVNGILQHVDAFYDTFAVKAGDKLYRAPEARAKIW